MFKEFISTSALKKNFQKSLLVSSIALLAACGSDDETESLAGNTSYEEITSDALPAGFAYTSTDLATYYADETYGPDTRNKFDIFLPESEAATPLVIFVHGGGFFTGDKATAIYDFAADGTPTPNADSIADINEVLEAGVAYATINYSLLDVPGFNDAEANDTEGLVKSLSDVKEALQYIRHNAAEFNIDPEKIAMYGVSAGASSSLWLAYSDDMADTSAGASSNASESTRIVAAGAIETQGSMDVVRWEEILAPIQVTLEVASTLTLSLMESVYGIASSDTATSLALIRAETGELADYRKTLDFPALIDDEDPAVFVSNTWVDLNVTGGQLLEIGGIAVSAPLLLKEGAAALLENDKATADAKFAELVVQQARAAVLGPAVINGLLHAPTHASTIATAAATAGAVVEAHIPTIGVSSSQTVIPFLLEELGVVQQP